MESEKNAFPEQEGGQGGPACLLENSRIFFSQFYLTLTRMHFASADLCEKLKNETLGNKINIDRKNLVATLSPYPLLKYFVFFFNPSLVTFCW